MEHHKTLGFKLLICFFAMTLSIVTFLWGCQRTTTIILPPDSTSIASSIAETTIETEMDSTASLSVPTAASTTWPSTTSTTEAPTVAPTVKPTAAPTDPPVTAPSATEAPTTVPTQAPTTVPTEAPTMPPEIPTEPTETVTQPEPTRHPVYDTAGHTIGSLERELLSQLNQHRAAREIPLPALTMDQTLCALSTIRAYECAQDFSQTRPDGRSGRTVLSDYGYDIWPNTSQRIHDGSTGLPASVILKAWEYNSSFSNDLFSDAYTHIGIGVWESGSRTYIVCIFAG